MNSATEYEGSIVTDDSLEESKPEENLISIKKPDVSNKCHTNNYKVPRNMCMFFIKVAFLLYF